MEDLRLLNKIKSSKIIQNIFNYIEDNNNLKLKLFFYSKSFQKKFKIRLIDYKVKFFDKIGFDISKYLFIEEEKYKKNYLNEKYENYLSEKKFNKEDFNNLIYDILENKKTNEINDDNITKEGFKLLINLDSPLFEVISKTKNFDKNYTIYMSQKNIDEFNLKEEYITIHDKLNKSNRKYSSLYFKFEDKRKINYLKEFNVDFNKIKRVDLFQVKEEGINDNEDNKYFFETLFSLNNIENNLIYLKIQFSSNNKIESSLFENINNLKSLKYLCVNSFYFDGIIKIELNNLKILSFEYCRNIDEFSIICEKLEILNLGMNQISNINNLENANLKELKILDLSCNDISDIGVLEKVKFEKLEILNLSWNKISNIDNLVNANFKELKELYLSYNSILNIDALALVKFDNLEILNLAGNIILNINILGNMNFKELKEINLSNNRIWDINSLEKAKFDKLEILNFRGNLISNINILEKVNFKNLKVLDLYCNNIQDIQVLEKVNFEKLETLNLSFNKIKLYNISSTIDILKSKNIKNLNI